MIAVDSLRQIDPLTLARETVQAAVDRVHSLAMAIEIGVTARLNFFGVSPEATTLGHAVRALTLYAQHGTPLDAPVQEYCITLIGVADEALDDATSPDVSTPLGLVVAAALCREDLEHGKPVRTTWLSALGGVTPGRVKQLVGTEALRVVVRSGDHYVHADDARRWLGGRGIVVERQSKSRSSESS